MKKRNLILVRHGQSEWNAKNLFTGWENPGLTETGKTEAENAGDLINNLDIGFDCSLRRKSIFPFFSIQK